MPCTRQMFGNKSVAVLACQAQFALQRNWFPDPIQVIDKYCPFNCIMMITSSKGLFSYQTWNGMDGFWQNGVVLEIMANCLHYLNNTRYLSLTIKQSKENWFHAYIKVLYPFSARNNFSLLLILLGKYQ